VAAIANGWPDWSVVPGSITESRNSVKWLARYRLPSGGLGFLRCTAISHNVFSVEVITF
jgi:hypothetical protein